MKATGIVRRIDDLGRVSIPKELRRTLRIREGDPMEIFIEYDNIVFKKYSPIKELEDFAKLYTKSLSETTGHLVLISDTDTIVATSHNAKTYLMKSLSSDFANITGKDATKMIGKECIPIVNDDVTHYTCQMVQPIFDEFDPRGFVIIVSADPKATMGLVDEKLIQTAAKFIGKYLAE